MGLVITCLISGCSWLLTAPDSEVIPFQSFYDAVTSSEKVVDPLPVDPCLTLSASSVAFPLFARLIADTYQVGVVYNEALGNKLITAEFRNSSLSDVLSVVARSLETDIARVGSTYYIGNLRPEDRGVLVRRVLGFTSDDLKSACMSIADISSRVTVLPNGTCIVSDKQAVLQRLAVALDELSFQDSSFWVLQLYFVSLKKDVLLKGGFTTETSGKISYNLSENRVEADNLNIDAFLDMIGNSSFVDLYASCVMVLRDGQPGSWIDGERVPIPKKTVSDQGTVTVSGYDYVQSGLTVNAVCNASYKGGLLTLDLTSSQVTGYVIEAPTISTTQYKFISDLETDKVYLLGELTSFSRVDSADSLFLGRDQGRSSLQVWGKLYKGRGGVLKPPPVYTPPQK